MKKKTNQEHPMISCSSDQLGLSEFLQVDFTTRIQDRIDPHTYPAMIFIVQSHFNKKSRGCFSVRASSVPNPPILNIWLLVLSGYRLKKGWGGGDFGERKMSLVPNPTTSCVTFLSSL